jgi:Putative MetA-pathway of phenol degradation
MVLSSPARLRTLLCSSFVLATGAAFGQAADTPAEPSPICTDRPTKVTVTCTADSGHLQVEADLVNFTHQHTGDVRTDTWLVTNPTVKFGLTDTLDVELNIAPWEVVRTRDDAGNGSTLHGPGDAFVRAKWKFYSDDKLSFALVPYVKAPSARHGIGNGAIEGGVLLPVAYALTDKLTVSTSPEFDSLKDADGVGHHFNTAQVVNLGYALPHDVTVYGELWGNWNVDPARTVRQYSADAAVAWAITKDLQVDCGLNVGLNRSTPSVQAYFGIARRF